MLIKFLIVSVIAWLVGVFGWTQIIGCLQNMAVRRGLLPPLILWVVIMALGAYFAIVTFDSLWALVVGYALAFIQVLSAGRIQ